MNLDTKDKEYVEKILNEYPRRENVLRRYDLEIEELSLNIDGGIQGIDYTKDKIQSSGTSSTIENQVMQIEKEKESIGKIKNRRNIHYNKIEIALETFTDLQNKLIEYRCFKGYTWDMCAKYIGYSDRQCMRIIEDIIKTLYSYYKIKEPKSS